MSASFVFACAAAMVSCVIVGARSVAARGRDPRRLLREATGFSIAELPPHVAGRLSGTVETTWVTVASPLSGTPCVYWSVRVYRDNRLMVDDRGGAQFTLVDHSGRAVIYPNVANSDLAPQHFTNAIAVSPDARQAAFLSKHNIDGHSFPFRFEEAVIATGLVAVVGYATRGSDGLLHMKPFAIGNDSASLGITVPQAHARIRGTP